MSETANEETPAIETRGLRKSFGQTTVLDGTDLLIPAGSSAVVLGPSGTGKSVLIKHVLGLLRPDAGEVLVQGREVTAMSRSELVKLRKRIGVMFQDGALFSSLTLFDNVAFPLRQHTDLEERVIHELVAEQLALVGLKDAAERLPAELSGGMKKRAGLARALVMQPPILFCDEPDSGLDPVRTALLGELLVQRHGDAGGTVVTVTHNVALARLISDYVAILWRGRVVAQGPSEEMFDSDDPFVRQFMAGDPEGPLGMDA